MLVFEVIGYPKTCYQEKFSNGFYKTRERAEEVKTQCEEEYSNCVFDIEEKWGEE